MEKKLTEVEKKLTEMEKLAEERRSKIETQDNGLKTYQEAYTSLANSKAYEIKNHEEELGMASYFGGLWVKNETLKLHSKAVEFFKWIKSDEEEMFNIDRDVVNGD